MKWHGDHHGDPRRRKQKKDLPRKPSRRRTGARRIVGPSGLQINRDGKILGEAGIKVICWWEGWVQCPGLHLHPREDTAVARCDGRALRIQCPNDVCAEIVAEKNRELAVGMRQHHQQLAIVADVLSRMRNKRLERERIEDTCKLEPSQTAKPEVVAIDAEEGGEK